MQVVCSVVCAVAVLLTYMWTLQPLGYIYNWAVLYVPPVIRICGMAWANSALQQPVSRTAAACMRASDCRWCSQRSFCYCSWCPWARRTHMRTQSQSLPDRHRAARGDERLTGGGADRGARFAPWRWRLTACRSCLRLHPQNLFFTHSTRINTKPTQFQCNYSFLKEI